MKTIIGCRILWNGKVSAELLRTSSNNPKVPDEHQLNFRVNNVYE
jgi:hypothetical protein